MLKRFLTRLRSLVVTNSWTTLWFFFVFSLLGVVFMLNNYTPLEIGPNGILLFFIAFYVLLLSATLLVLSTYRRLFHRSFSMIKALNIASVLAFAPIMLLALNTLNQLQVLDVILVILFECLAIFYISRRGKR